MHISDYWHLSSSIQLILCDPYIVFVIFWVGSTDMAGTGTISSMDLHNVGDGKDFISNLPDDILRHILSLLPAKDAVGTSILARRWKSLWIDLSAFNFDRPTNQLFDLVHILLKRSNSSSPLRLRIAMHGSGVTVDRAKFQSFLYYAKLDKVEELNISLDLKSNPFILPITFSSASLNSLCLELKCVLHIPSWDFPSLKTLVISSVIFANNNSLRRPLSGCILQKLVLHGCDWKNIQEISVVMPTLRELSITFPCFDADYFLDSKVKIDAENLLSFSCIGCLTFEFVLVNLTSIVEAYIDFSSGFPSDHLYIAAHEIKLLSGLHRVKSLSLTIDTLEVCIIYHLHYFNIVAFNYVFFSIQTTFFLSITITNRFFPFYSVFHMQ